GGLVGSLLCQAVDAAAGGGGTDRDDVATGSLPLRLLRWSSAFRRCLGAVGPPSGGTPTKSEDRLKAELQQTPPRDREDPRKIPSRSLPWIVPCPKIVSDNLVGILSRVAEGIGPVKPQQPVPPPTIPRCGRGTLVLPPTRLGPAHRAWSRER